MSVTRVVCSRCFNIMIHCKCKEDEPTPINCYPKYKIPKEEIAEMIVREIGMFRESKIFYPFSITKINIEFPDDVEIELEYVLMGEDVRHKI